jgi:hypothetical protein
MSVEGLGLRGQGFAAERMRGAPMMAGAAPTVMRFAVAGSPPPAPAQPGFLSRAMGALSKAFGGGADNEARDLDQEEGSEAGRTFRGRAKAVGHQLIIQFTVEGGDLDWQPGTELDWAWADGRRLTAKIVQATSAGRVREGEEIRLVLERLLGGEPPDRLLIGTAPHIVVMLST